MCDTNCIGNCPGANLGGLGRYGSLHILDTDTFSMGIDTTPAVISPMNEGVNNGVIINGTTGRINTAALGAYEIIADMSFSLNLGSTVLMAFYINNTLVPDTEQELKVSAGTNIEYLGIFGQYEVTGTPLNKIIEIRVSALNTRTLSIEHLTFGAKGIG